MTETGEKRSYHHDRAPERSHLTDKISTCDIIFIDILSLERIYTLVKSLHFDSHTLKNEDKVLHVKYFRNIGNYNFLLCKKDRTDDLQGLVLRTLRTY